MAEYVAHDGSEPHSLLSAMSQTVARPARRFGIGGAREVALP